MDRNPPVASRFRGSPPKLDVTLVAIQAPGEAKKADKKKRGIPHGSCLKCMYVHIDMYILYVYVYIYTYTYNIP